MSVRRIVSIDEEKCTGCGECVPACAEGAIRIVDGVAKLIADNLCDGLGACLGECPEDAITIEEREADDFDEGAVAVRLEATGDPPEPRIAAVRPHAEALPPEIDRRQPLVRGPLRKKLLSGWRRPDPVLSCK